MEKPVPRQIFQIKDSTGWIETHELMYSKFPDDRRRIVTETNQDILDRIGAKAEPVEKIFDSLRDMTMGILEVNKKMLSTISNLESENKLLREEIERLKAEPIRVGPPVPRCSFTACHWPKCDCNKF